MKLTSKILKVAEKLEDRKDLNRKQRRILNAVKAKVEK